MYLEILIDTRLWISFPRVVIVVTTMVYFGSSRSAQKHRYPALLLPGQSKVQPYLYPLAANWLEFYPCKTTHIAPKKASAGPLWNLEPKT